MIEIYNSFTKRKEEFKPIEPGKVRMYVCGMTVYDLCHLGHARVLVVFDVIVRYLRSQQYDVTYVRNITDIDDKIINRANENGETINELTGRFIQAMHEDCDALNVLPPDIEPRATTSMQEIIDMIKTLEEKGFTYAASNGDIYYDVGKFKPYGALSGRKLEDQIAGARVEVDEVKRNPEDFVLWKAAKPEEPSWDSPWGTGRPGWHIECSAMSTDCLGDHFDIHGGGMDLKFPHHENEIAQTEACTGHKSVNYWIHNGFVQVDKEKMSKSLGNFFTVREVLKSYQPEEVRFFILNSHYRSPLNYTQENLEKARNGLTTLYTALRGITPVADPGADHSDWRQAFDRVMNDDFNTAGAIAVLFDLAHEANRVKSENAALAASLCHEIVGLGAILGILQDDPEVYLQGGAGSQDNLDVAEIEDLINRRNQARKDRDFAEADRIRDQLVSMGILIEDGAGGTTWRKQ